MSTIVRQRHITCRSNYLSKNILLKDTGSIFVVIHWRIFMGVNVKICGNQSISVIESVGKPNNSTISYSLDTHKNLT